MSFELQLKDCNWRIKQGEPGMLARYVDHFTAKVNRHKEES